MAARWLALLFLIEIFSLVAANVRCVHKGKKYHPGEKLSKNCNTCYCLQHGDWLCTQRTCRLTDFTGILLIPSNDVIISRGSKLYVICRSDRKRSRFMWFVNGQHMTSPSKMSSMPDYGESVLLLDTHDFKRRSIYVTCFVPPFAPKRIKVTIADGPSLPTGIPRIASQPVVMETSPNYGVSIKCNANGLQPMQVTWFKFRVPLSNDNPAKWIVTPDGTLIIPTPIKSDSGLYECMVTNEIGAAISSRAIELVVNKGLPIKGAWCGWKQTSEKCNATCGGYLHFERECACPAPKNGGSECPGLKEKLVACNVDQCYKEVYGEINVEKMRNEDILKGSCLHIGYMPFVGCRGKKDCESSSLITIRDFRIHQGTYRNYVKYNMRLPRNLSGKFKFAALLQMGHCQEKLTAYELFEKDCVKPVGDQVTHIGVLSDSSSRVLVNLDAQYEEKSQVLRTSVSFRPKIAKLPPNSCLQILLWNDVICQGPSECKPVQILQVPNPTIKDWKVAVNITLLSALDPRIYLIDGHLNIGWCAEDSKVQQRTKTGDYVSLAKKYLFVDQLVTEYRIDLTMDKIREIEEKKDLPLGGTVTLQGYTMQTIPSPSCLIVELREVYRCNKSKGCRRPYVSEERVKLTNAALKRAKDVSEFSYRVLFKNVIGDNFEVNGIVNVGWCKDFVKGKRMIKSGDYFTVQSHELNVEHGINDAPVDLKMSRARSSYAFKKGMVQGRMKYEAGLSSKLLEKSCVRLILAKYDCKSRSRCKKTPFLTKTYKDLLTNVKNTLNFKINYRDQRKISELYLYAVMNVGWCSEGLKGATSLRPGDLVGFVEIKKRNIDISIKLEKQSKFKVVDTPFRKADLDQGSSKSKILLSLPSDFDGQIPSSSCMVVTIRKEKSCRNKILCSNEVVALKVFRGITKSENNSVQIDMALKEALELNVRYQFDIVLNNGWCSEGATNASWIKDGDLFTSFEQQFKNGTSAKNIVEKIRVFKDDDQKSEKCNIKCPRLLDPVCGSNNRTYNSFCVLKREACIFESGVTLLHKGECERCKRSCSTKIEPICARNGKTYDNLCIMKREACFEGSFLAFRHYGKCGSVTMRGDVRFSLDQPLPDATSGSCLVIKTRKAVYCKFPERCPDYELAEVVLKDVIVPPDGKIPYEVVMNPRPMSSVYLVEAVLNRGWCSAESSSKEWIRNEDYFNVKEQPFAVQGSEEIYKDVPVTKLVNLKVVEKGTIPSAIRDPCSIIECPFHGKCHMINGKATCRCKLMCRLDAEPVCGTDGETYANDCVLKSESCLTKKSIEIQHKGRCENTLKISGDILVDKLIPRIPAGSCLNIKIQQKCNESEGKCDFETLAEIKRKSVLIPPSNRLYYQTIMKPRPPSGVYIISVVLNRGWCAGNRGGTEWIRIGDYLNYFHKEFVISETGNIEKDVVIMRFLPKNGEKNYVVVEGEVLFDGTESKMSNGSCMSIALHKENGSCEGGCKTQPVVRFYIKNLSMLSNKKIPYRAVIKPRPAPGSYILSVILNQGWCSEGSSELIREGDLFINEGQKLEIGLAGDVYRDVKIIKYYPPGMPCVMKDSNKVPNGADMTINGNGCHGCKCNNGTIVCQPTACPPLDCRNGFLAIEDGDCCPTCVRYAKCHDSESGRNYKYGEEIFSRGKDYCKTCSCNMTGKFSCSKEVCPQLDCKNQIYIKSSCCPVCSSDIKCKHHRTGMLYKAGETWINGEMNGCSKCKCVTKPGSKSLGFIECIKPSCPRLNCVQQVYPKGYCCPVCLKEKASGPFKEEDISYLQALIFNEVVSSEVSCSDSTSGKIYVEGEKWSHGCMDYECKRSGIESKAKSCPYLTCPQKYHVTKPGDCCPSCSAECLPKLLCTGDSIILIVPRIFLPYTRPTELVFSNCTSSGNGTHFILKTAFNQCGMKRSLEGDLMKYSNIAYTREDENAVISRVQLVQIPVACMYPAHTQRILSREFVKRNRGISVVSPIPKDTGPVKAFDVFMKITDEKGVEQDAGQPMKFDPGEKVYVEIDGTGLVENKLKVKADYCYLTPTPGPKSLLNYTLIENGCGVDSTVEFQEPKGNGQRFSFRALIFTKTKVPGFYLHCDSVTCDEEDPKCTTGCRPRRALYRNQPNKITREKADDHQRKMKLTLHVVLG